MHTSIDCFEKRQKKGYLFTMGDEFPPPDLTRGQIKEFVGDDIERDYTTVELLEMAQRSYHVFHIIIEQGNGCRHMGAERTAEAWTKLLGQHAIRLSDYTKLAEVIVSTIQVVEGEDTDTVAKSWSGDTSLVVQRAIGGLTTDAAAKSGGVVRL
jgi:hypothetical protein